MLVHKISTEAAMWVHYNRNWAIPFTLSLLAIVACDFNWNPFLSNSDRMSTLLAQGLTGTAAAQTLSAHLAETSQAILSGTLTAQAP